MTKYSIGVDYGTGSGRVVLLDLSTGVEVAKSVIAYQHGVIEERLPSNGTKLPPEWALQHPNDYLDVLNQGIPEVLQQVGDVKASDIIGIGIDFTSCTVLPVTENGMPLCLLKEWEDHPHAWPKLWKHHAAQPIADRINDVATHRGDSFLSRYGGRISSEWYFPKLIEVFEEDADVYHFTAKFIEATDWIVWFLTGAECRNSCTAGYKAMWSEDEGIPDAQFFNEVSPGFVNPSEKLGSTFYPLGTKAGTLRPELAAELGLTDAVCVAVGNVDAMVSAPSVGVTGAGSLVMVIGTSICHIMVGDKEVRLPGITGVVKGGVLPDFYGYEAGQAAVGDMFEWFIRCLVPSACNRLAEESGLSIYDYLEGEAAAVKPGQSGLVALDWWNGNRSILGDANLSGVILGLTLASTPGEIYRALLESVAFGTRRIIDNFVEHGVPVDRIFACGGIAQKNRLLMQIYADICGVPVIVPSSSEIPARGAAMFGAVAAGQDAGGFDSIQAAIATLASSSQYIYEPSQSAHQKYNEIYTVYRQVYESFGVENKHFLHTLKHIRHQSLQA